MAKQNVVGSNPVGLFFGIGDFFDFPGLNLQKKFSANNCVSALKTLSWEAGSAPMVRDAREKKTFIYLCAAVELKSVRSSRIECEQQFHYSEPFRLIRGISSKHLKQSAFIPIPGVCGLRNYRRSG